MWMETNAQKKQGQKVGFLYYAMLKQVQQYFRLGIWITHAVVFEELLDLSKDGAVKFLNIRTPEKLL